MSERLITFDLGGTQQEATSWETHIPQPVEPKQRIRLPGDGRLVSEFSAELGENLRLADVFLFQDEVMFDSGSEKGLTQLTPSRFVSWIEHWVHCYRLRGENQIIKSLSVSEAAKVLASQQFRSKLKVIGQFHPIRLPVIEHDKMLLLPTGYHAGTRTLTRRKSTVYDLTWTVDRAIAYLNELLVEFPFVGSNSKPAVIAGMLTSFGFGLLSSTCCIPAFVYTSNDSGGGKGLCAKLATLPVFGTHPTGVLPTTDNGLKNELFAVAKGGQKLLIYDNVDRPLVGGPLEAFITGSEINSRLLGASQSETHSKKCIIFVTGNNCCMMSDMRRRCIIGELFTEHLQPEFRRILNLGLLRKNGQ